MSSSPATVNDTLRVTVRDKGYMLLPYIYSDIMQPLALTFKSRRQSATATGPMTSAEMLKQLSNMLFKSTVIVSIKPERFEFAYNYGENKKVPVS